MYSIIVPCYNEAQNIAALLGKVSQKKGAEVIVVDDGSSDETAEIVGRFVRGKQNVKLIKHRQNLGKGAAILSGLKVAKNDKIVMIDADHQHDPAEIEKLVGLLGNADLVIGSRFLNGKNKMPLHRLVANFLVRLVVWKVTDPLSGFRAFKKSRVKFSAKDFKVELDMLFNAFEKGCKVTETPIKVIYKENKSSKISKLHLAVPIYLSLFIYALRRALSG